MLSLEELEKRYLTLGRQSRTPGTNPMSTRQNMIKRKTNSIEYNGEKYVSLDYKNVVACFF